jgi:hypothetical protein
MHGSSNHTKKEHDVITIGNDGQSIATTDFWGSELEFNGFFFLSWNAGAARLLVPDCHKASLRDMKTAAYAILSRGKYNGHDAIEILFEDNSDAPYCVQILAEQCDRLLPAHEQGGGFTVAVWTREGLQISMPGKYRVVHSLPCGEPWAEQ